MKKSGNGIIKVLTGLVVIAVLFAAVFFIYRYARRSAELKKLAEEGYYNPVSVGDYSLNVAAFGNRNGEHTIVWIAGSYEGEFAGTLRENTAQLEADNLVVFIDRAGYGLSDSARGELTPERIVEDYRTALKNAGISAPYILMPYSDGGVYAFYWESGYPEEIEALAYIDAGFIFDEGGTDYTVEENSIPKLFAFYGKEDFERANAELSSYAADGTCDSVLGKTGFFRFAFCEADGQASEQSSGAVGDQIAGFINDIPVNREKLVSLRTFTKEAPVDMYSMRYFSSFRFDDYLVKGFEGDTEKGEFITRNVMESLQTVNPVADHYCSTFVCHNEKGEVLFCRNFDTSAISPCCIVTTEGRDGYRSIGGSDLGLAYSSKIKDVDVSGIRKVLLLALPYYTHDGMNEYGLAVSLLSAGKAVTGKDESKKQLNVLDTVRIVLEKAKNVDEAIELLSSYTVDFGTVYNNYPMHYMIADASGRSVVADYSEGYPVFVESSIVTNFNLYGDARGVGQDRYAIIENTLTERDYVLSEEEALQLLSRVCMKNMERYSVVYNLTTGDVTAFSHGDCSVTAEFHLDMKR